MNSQSEIKSFYIPRVHIDTTEQYIKYIFNLAGIGMPYRVDFAPCGISKGFQANTSPQQPFYKSAFVHFNSFYPAAGSVISFVGLRCGMFQTLQYEPYWRILTNRNPVPATMMNSHQIVANCCALEERVAQLEADKEYDSKTIDLMTRRISILEKNLYRLSDFVFHTSTSREQDANSVSSHSSMPILEMDGPTEEEIASAYEIVPQDDTEHEEEDEDQEEEHEEEEHEEEDTHSTNYWLVQTIRDNTEATLASTKRERILFTTDICGNE